MGEEEFLKATGGGTKLPFIEKDYSIEYLGINYIKSIGLKQKDNINTTINTDRSPASRPIVHYTYTPNVILITHGMCH